MDHEGDRDDYDGYEGDEDDEDGGPGLEDIYASTVSDDWTFSPPVLVPELSSPLTDMFPTPRRDGRELVLTRTVRARWASPICGFQPGRAHRIPGPPR
jgi:hypothetical protein